MDKSYVTMEQYICQACGNAYDTGTILLDCRLKNTFNPRTITSAEGICPACKEKIREGYIIAIEIDPSKSTINTASNTILPKDAHRTGIILYIRREAFSKIFNIKIDNSFILTFIEPAVTEKLKAMLPPEH